MDFTKGDTVVHKYDVLRYKKIYFVNKVNFLFLGEDISKLYFSRTSYFCNKDNMLSFYLAENYKSYKSLLIEKSLIWV